MKGTHVYVTLLIDMWSFIFALYYSTKILNNLMSKVMAYIKAKHEPTFS